MSHELTGTIKVIFDTQTFPSGFSKREFVVTTQEQYPQDVKFEAIKEKGDMLDSYNEGDQVNVKFNIRGNEYNGRYYVNLQSWQMSKIDGGSAGDSIPDLPPLEPSQMDGPDQEDDLPF
ncbi:MAG: DUF3127 domain-containing protein [Flavobacteriales bacterium]|nr:DUF3127 domain-containing protein [Flavobacteriales bacterium]